MHIEEKDSLEKVLTRYYLVNNHETVSNVCVKESKCYVLTLGDYANDGMQESGYYEITVGDQVIKESPGDFGSITTKEFCTGAAEPTPTAAPNNPPPTPTPAPSGFQFQMEIETDNHPEDYGWKLRDLDTRETYQRRRGFYSDEDKNAIIYDSARKWVLEDGHCYVHMWLDDNGQDWGYVSGKVNDDILFNTTAPIEGPRENSYFCIGCVDSTTFRFNNKNRWTCAAYATSKGRCRKNWDGRKVSESCPNSCSNTGLVKICPSA